MKGNGLTTHGPGFRFVDRFERSTPTSGQGWKYLDESEPFFADHFPGKPLMPAVLLVECAAQTGGVLLMEESSVSDGDLFLASIDHFRIIAPVVPGETVRTAVTVVKDFGALVQFDTECFVQDKIVARGRLTLSRKLASPAL